MAIQTPDRFNRAKLPNNKSSDAGSLEGLSNRVEADLLESKFAKKIILLLYSHLRKLARGALQHDKSNNDPRYCKGPKVNYKAMMEANGVVFSLPNCDPDELDELAINVELKVPMNMFEGDYAEKLLKGRKFGDSLSRCRRRCCKRRNKRGSDRDGYVSEPDERSRKRRRDGCGEKKRHCSAPNRRVSSEEEEDFDVLEARTRRIKEYLDSSTAAGGAQDPCELERELRREEEECIREKEKECLKEREGQQEEPCAERGRERECGEERRLLNQEVDEICVENANREDREHPENHHHRHHHKNHHKHHHHKQHHHHMGLDGIAEGEGEPRCCRPVGVNECNRITWPKDAYLAKHQHHGTFWPLWTESPYCRQAETLADVPTVERDCTAEETEWEAQGRQHRRWSEMDGAHGSHFTSVSEPGNEIYTVSCEGQHQQQCGGMGGHGEEEEEEGKEHHHQCNGVEVEEEHECQPEDLSMNQGAPYHMELRMAGPFYPETITRVMAPGQSQQQQQQQNGAAEDCVVHSAACKGQLMSGGLQFNYY